MSAAQLKERLTLYSLEDWNALDQMAIHYDLRRLLRENGWTNLVLGGLTLLLGITQIQNGILHIIQAIAGLVTVAVSIYALMRENVRTVQLFAGIFIFAAAWNLWIVLQYLTFGTAWLLLVLPCLQFWSGRRFMYLYGRLKVLYQGRPTTIPVEYDPLWAALNAGDLSEDGDFVEILINRRKWRGLLLPEFAVIIPMRTKRTMLVVPKNDFVLLARSKADFKKPEGWHEAAASFGQGQKPIVQIRNRYFQRYLTWKGKHSIDASIANKLTNVLQTREIIRVLATIVLGIILVGFVGLLLLTLRYA